MRVKFFRDALYLAYVILFKPFSLEDYVDAPRPRHKLLLILETLFISLFFPCLMLLLIAIPAASLGIILNLQVGIQRFLLGAGISFGLGIFYSPIFWIIGNWIQKREIFGTLKGAIAGALSLGITVSIAVGYLGYLVFNTANGSFFMASFGALAGTLGGAVVGMAGGRIKSFSSEAFAFALYITFVEALAFSGVGSILGILNSKIGNVGYALLFGIAGGIIASPIIALMRVGLTGFLVGLVETLGGGLLYWYFFNGSDQAITGAIAFACGYAAFFFRLYLYPVELGWTLINYSRAKNHPEEALSLLHSSPAYFDELVWLPLASLDSHLVLVAYQDYDTGITEISRVSQSFSQGWAARKALVRLASLSLEKKK